MEKAFKENDLVFLAAADARMTVLGYNTHGEVVCFWYDGGGALATGTFPESFLEKVEYTDPPYPFPLEA